jgi:hypothetical protein
MAMKENSTNFVDYAKKKLSFFDLEAKKRFAVSKDIVSYSANRVTNASRSSYLLYLFISIIIFTLVYFSILFIFKPIKEFDELKITRESLIGLSEAASSEPIRFVASIPVMVKWNNEYYFFDKPNNEGKYNIELSNKEGMHKFYFYAYKPSIFERLVSNRPVLVTKEFDYTKPKLGEVKLEDKYNSKNPVWTFESDESKPMITMVVNGVEKNIYDPQKTFQDNPCKQEIKNDMIKYSCPLIFEKEESQIVSAYMMDKVSNRVDIITDKKVTYYEPLKVDCGQIGNKVRSNLVNLKCKVNRTTKFVINDKNSEVIEKDKDKNISLVLDSDVSDGKEYQFILKFDDPNGSPVELSYKFVKDNNPPIAQFVPSSSKVNSHYNVTTTLNNLSESARIDLAFDPLTSPSPNWYFKVPDNQGVDVQAGNDVTFNTDTSDYKLCTKDPISNTETCSSAYKPSLVNYTIKLTDNIGNQSTYQCDFDLNGGSSSCRKF